MGAKWWSISGGSSPGYFEGPNIALRLIRRDDAEYVHELRSNPTYNLYLSKVHGTAEDQRQWIENYKVRERAGTEFYYVIERRDRVRCGLVRLYNIHANEFTWGSWILDHNKPRKAALESAVISLGIGFEHLSKSFAHVDVNVGNIRAEGFYRRFGMQEVGADDREINFLYSRERFRADLDSHMAVLAEETS
ncbi:GNAT family N-acetyltransferase [Mesorhizobium sp. NPDC059054]|uniref:GNAT family N-acetyltransferase n=1 Tax=Mesorhizobium sp. NPDC059054 TaxID=3346711 RepID=UPI00367F78A2